MISSVSSSFYSGYTGIASRSLLPALVQSRPDQVAKSDRVDRADIEEYYRVRFNEVSLGSVLPPSVGPRNPVERYLEIAAL